MDIFWIAIFTYNNFSDSLLVSRQNCIVILWFVCVVVFLLAPNFYSQQQYFFSISLTSFLTYLSVSSVQPALSSVQFHLPALQSWNCRNKNNKKLGFVNPVCETCAVLCMRHPANISVLHVVLWKRNVFGSSSLGAWLPNDAVN